MGASSSKNHHAKKKSVNPYSKSGTTEGQHHQQQHELQKQNKKLSPPQLQERNDKENQEPGIDQTMQSRLGGYSSSEDEFYDGIPRFRRSPSQKSKSRRAAKVAEVSSRLGRAGNAGLVRTVEALDMIGSSMTNLNLSSGFVSGATSKGNELSILSFEVANTIVKGSNLMHSLSRRSIRQLKDVVLPSEGVQLLVSDDMDELLSIVADDKRKELQIFAGEVVRFGNQCKDPQWHNLDRFFEKYRREPTPQKQLMEEAELMMQQLMTLVQYTAVSIMHPALKSELQNSSIIRAL